MASRQQLAVVSVVLLGGSLAAYFGLRPAAVPSPTPPVVVASEGDAGIIAWCGEGLEAIAGGGCFALPQKTETAPAPLLIYLHGMYEQNATTEELDQQKRVAKHATARGFAVLALRGRLGLCTASPIYATWYCWPSNERSADAGASVVEDWAPALREADRRLGGTGKRYVLGFSNGGFFSGLLAVRALFAADGFAVAGAGPIEPVHVVGPKPPLLLISANDDPSQEGMLRLDQELTREGWVHENYSREGGHMLPDPDIEAALTFFVRTRTEKVPLSPPLSTHHPRVHVPDASPEEDVAENNAPDAN